jgi:hypothetical protein
MYIDLFQDMHWTFVVLFIIGMDGAKPVEYPFYSLDSNVRTYFAYFFAYAPLSLI